MPGPDPDEDLELILELETVFDGGFGKLPSMYPVTIAQARYQGTYEGGTWLAFPVRPWNLNAEGSAWAGWNGSDLTCMTWHEEARKRGVPVGRSGTPDGAYQELLRQVAAAADVDLDAVTQAPEGR